MLRQGIDWRGRGLVGKGKDCLGRERIGGAGREYTVKFEIVYFIQYFGIARSQQ